MNFVFFVHSIVSDWNHGNAHFLRGLMSALAAGGHSVRSYEPRRSWSLENLIEEHGASPVVEFARSFPEIDVRAHSDSDVPGQLEAELRLAVADADVVIVHEWNSPEVVNTLARIHGEDDRFALLFHDTHHRPWSDPAYIERFDLQSYDGVIAFGEVLREIYRERFGARRTWTMHEAADVRRFRPLQRERTQDVIWIGNWGDEERSEELRSFWLDSARALPDLRFVAHGVRYPGCALDELEQAGVEFRRWAPSLQVPEIFAASGVTLHIPRRAYVQALRGIPTIRIFEALACGIPLVSAPWMDVEGLFRDGDYRVAQTPGEMRDALRLLATDECARAEQAAHGLETILARHTCDHRATELMNILNELGRAGSAGATTTSREKACA